jgi:hypothetical protein
METGPGRLRDALGEDVVLDLKSILDALRELDRRCVSLIVAEERTGDRVELVPADVESALDV